jgi:hypothetical protein
MKTILLAFFSLALSTGLQSQVLVGKPASSLAKKLAHYHPVLQSSSDSILIYDLKYSNADNQGIITATFYLTKTGKVRTQKISSDCRKCFRAYLNSILEQSKYKWKQVNGNQYVSKFSKRLLLETDPEFNPTFFMVGTTWTKNSYKLLFD